MGNKLKLKLDGCPEMSYSGDGIMYRHDKSLGIYNVIQYDTSLAFEKQLITFHESALVYMMWVEPEQIEPINNEYLSAGVDMILKRKKYFHTWTIKKHGNSVRHRVLLSL